MKKMFIDLDGVVFHTVKIITDLYNADHIMYKDFKMVKPAEIKTWNFDELNLEPREFIDRYFNQPRFFEKPTLMVGCSWIINKLHNDFGYKIVFCSSGSYANLKLKQIWIDRHFGFADFIPVEMPTYKDKSHVKMSGKDTEDINVFIDDVSKNLVTSDADIKICFGDIYSWNEDWDGVRCRNWMEVYEYIRELEG